MREKAPTPKIDERVCKHCGGTFLKSQYCPVDGHKLTRAKVRSGAALPVDPLADVHAPHPYRCPLCALDLPDTCYFCPADGEPLFAKTAYSGDLVQVCPKCLRRWAHDSYYCPQDGSPLQAKRPAWLGGDGIRTCSVCGEDSKGLWCPKDETPLVPALISNFDRACGGDILLSKETWYLVVKRLCTTRSSVILKVVDLNKSHKKFILIKCPNVIAGDQQVVRKLQRFIRQRRDAMRMKHPNIVKMLSSHRTNNGFPFHVLEYVERAVPIESLHGKFSELPLNYFVEIFSRVCDALQYAHNQGVLHQDLSSNDILIGRSPDRDDEIVVKVTDFGKGNPLLHSDNRDQQLTEMGDFFGHPEYLSPEAINNRELDARSNVFSLGCIMYLALSKTNPFEAPHWVALFLRRIKQATPPLADLENEPDLTERVDFIVQRCLSIDPQLRYQSMGDVKAALQALPIANSEKISYQRLRLEASG